MFLGEYEHTIDAKGRVAIPARFRAQMKLPDVWHDQEEGKRELSGKSSHQSGKRVDLGGVISKGMGTCLSVYTMQRWEEKSNELVAGKSSEELRDFERRIYPSASEVELDAQGRIVIPAKLRAYAHLDNEETNEATNEVTIVGVRDHFEIWNRAAWQAYQERLDAEGGGIPF